MEIVDRHFFTDQIDLLCIYYQYVECDSDELHVYQVEVYIEEIVSPLVEYISNEVKER